MGRDHSNTSILVVDDEHDIVNFIKQSLEINGFQVHTFTDALSALEYFNLNPKAHHVVISDIRMPGMNGYEFVKQVKKLNPKVKIILMSAFEIKDKEFHNVLPDIKVDTFLQKPFCIAQLKEVTKKISTRA